MTQRPRIFCIASLMCTALSLPAQEAPPAIRILNGSRQTLDIFRLKTDEERMANGSILPGQAATITTTPGHRFTRVGREDRAESTITSKVPVPVPALRFDAPSPEGGPPFYTQAVSAEGFPIVAFAKVNPYALKEAAFLINRMLERCPDVCAALIQSGARRCLLAHDGFTTDLPEFAPLAEEMSGQMGGLDGELESLVIRRMATLADYDPAQATGIFTPLHEPIQAKQGASPLNARAS
jgi:hypothetical protein